MYKILICSYLRNSGADGGCSVHSTVVEFASHEAAEVAVAAIQTRQKNPVEWHKAIRLYVN